MIRKLFFILVILCSANTIIKSQDFVSTSELFKRNNVNPHDGQLKIIQDPSLDTLISRYILGFKNLEEKRGGSEGMEGFRIQIYFKNTRNAREESNKIRALFISKFPGLITYQTYQDPGYFIIRVGDFRTKTEATRWFVLINKEREFQDAAYIVPDIINFPDKNTD
jgi:hypothetical protein